MRAGAFELTGGSLLLYLPVDRQGTKVLKLPEQRGQARSALVPQDKEFICDPSRSFGH